MFRLSLCIVPFAAALSAAAANVPAPARTAPAAGISIPAQDRERLESGSTQLAREIETLRARAGSETRVRELLPDVEIFHKAVDWALRYDEFFRSNEVAQADNLLRLGTARAQQLAGGRPAWLASTGLVVRGYRSKIDGSVQPYGLVVPATFAADTNRPRRLDVWLHGRDDKLTELKFISDRLRSTGEFAPPDTIVLHPYGRFCNAFKFVGETDVFEALDHAGKYYPMDRNRLAIRGFSMGGAGTWHLGAHHADNWAAVNPGAGFVDVKNYQKLGGNLETIPWYEQKLWNFYDPLACPINLLNSTLVAYSGADDPQKAAADLMKSALLREGVKMTHIIGPRTGHKYEPEAKKAVAKLVEEAMNKGIHHQPKRVTLVTHSLKWNRAHWLTIDALDKHWDAARVEAEWAERNLSPSANAGLAKRHNLQGPIDDAFMGNFLVLRPTKPAANPNVAAWLDGELSRFTNEWRAQLRGEARVRDADDAEAANAATNDANLILWGDPASNPVLANLLHKLPLQWDAKELRLGTHRFDATTHVPVLIFPNPLNPSRYIVLNSGPTFLDFATASNAQQTPKLPDFAVLDISVPRAERLTRGVAFAGFFEENWNVAPTRSSR